MSGEQPSTRRGGSRPGAGRPGYDTPATNLRIPATAAAQLLALTRQRRALGNPRLSQTEVAADLIAEAFAALDAEYRASADA